MFHQTCSRFAIEAKCSGAIFAAALAQDDDADGLTRRVGLLYELFNPKRKATSGA